MSHEREAENDAIGVVGVVVVAVAVVVHIVEVATVVRRAEPPVVGGAAKATGGTYNTELQSITDKYIKSAKRAAEADLYQVDPYTSLPLVY